MLSEVGRTPLGSVSLRGAADTFVTFLYAASVHLVIDHSLEHGAASALALLLVLFLFSDWLSRVALPWRLAETRAVGLLDQLLKTVLEVSGLFFLVVALVGLVRGGYVTPETAGAEVWPLSPQVAFSCFLLATFGWNLLMLRNMGKLTWRKLAGWMLKGNALDSGDLAVQENARRFWNWYEGQDRRYRDRRSQDDGLDAAGTHLGRLIPAITAKGFASAFTQYVCHHLVWVSLGGGISLFVGAVWLDGESLLKLVPGNPAVDAFVLDQMRRPYVLSGLVGILAVIYLVSAVGGRKPIARTQWALFVVLFALAFLPLVADIPDGALEALPYVAIPVLVSLIPAALFMVGELTRGALMRFIGASALSVVLVPVFVFLPGGMLMTVIAILQVLVNAFLQYASSGPEYQPRVQRFRFGPRNPGSLRFTRRH